MKTIVFLDRLRMTTLYIKLTNCLNGIKIVHIAYSEEEAKILIHNGIKPDYIYLDLFKEEYDNCIVDRDYLRIIESDIVKYSNKRFNLNSAIQSDRGFALLNYDECLKSVISHYNVWCKIFKDQHVDLIAHEPCSLFFNFIASILCKKQGGVYSYQVSSRSDKYKFAYLNDNNDDNDYIELKHHFKYYYSNIQEVDCDRCKQFLLKFREEKKVFLGDVINRRKPFLKLLYIAIKAFIYKIIHCNKEDRIYNNISYWGIVTNKAWNKVLNILYYKIYGISFTKELPNNEDFFFYPIHLEPEAAISFLGDGLYKNQIKLIENIAASLPVGFYLYVKDHPHEYAYRSFEDYKRLLDIPNIRLLDQSIPAKVIIPKSAGVITINGTSGFEAMLMNKKVFCFGNNQYSFLHRVHYVENIKDLRDIIDNSMDENLTDDEELMAYVMAYLESCHPGYTDCYTGGHYIDNFDEEENAKQIAKDMVNYIDYLNSLCK